ncbi:uncharacterized protein LOC128246245 [Mya arenaria]|uniref:uncharacterized protein LOC128246245 n=1 Tax=Mya arenaria TaxID=6604 RepID=UPI0022E7F269|nr:uncharacterized protein LOC128246245 [Mya arenaria]
MFENRPELIEIFANFRGRDIGDLQRSGLIRQHALKVMGTIDKCISRIDEPENLAKLLIETGALHRKYNVPPDLIQIIFPHFLNAIKPHIEDYWTEDIATAWKTLFRIMTHYMKIGMNSDSNNINTGVGQTIVYDHVITNVGGAYHNKTGIFTTPVSGVYVFNVDTMLDPGHRWLLALTE